MVAWAPPDWRDADVYAPVLAGGRPALAWELLRRDPDYRMSAATDCSAGGGPERWGLHFRG